MENFCPSLAQGQSKVMTGSFGLDVNRVLNLEFQTEPGASQDIE